MLQSSAVIWWRNWLLIWNMLNEERNKRMSEIYTKVKSAMVFEGKRSHPVQTPSFGTEHLPLGLILEQRRHAGSRAAGLTAEIVALKIESLTGYGSKPQANGSVFTPYSPRAKKVILSATDEAERLRSATCRNRALTINLLSDEVLATRFFR